MKLTSLSDLGHLLPESDPNSGGKKKPFHDGQGKTVCVVLDSKGRKGKTVTMVSGLQHNPKTLEDIAKILKQYCGAGGTVKNGNIEIQGDQSERVIEKLTEMNYVIKKQSQNKNAFPRRT